MDVKESMRNILAAESKAIENIPVSDAYEAAVEAIAEDPLSGTFRNEDIYDVFATLSDMYKFEYKIKKNHITIY